MTYSLQAGAQASAEGKRKDKVLQGKNVRSPATLERVPWIATGNGPDKKFTPLQLFFKIPLCAAATWGLFPPLCCPW